MTTFWYRYAQRRGGMKLHITEAFGENRFSDRPLCGQPGSGWRSTYNVPLAYSCHNCNRVYVARGLDGVIAP